MTISIVWMKSSGWMCHIFQDGAESDVTVVAVGSHPLSLFLPIDDQQTDALVAHRVEIEKAIHKQYPGSRIEFGKAPAKL